MTPLSSVLFARRRTAAISNGQDRQEDRQAPDCKSVNQRFGMMLILLTSSSSAQYLQMSFATCLCVVAPVPEELVEKDGEGPVGV